MAQYQRKSLSDSLPLYRLGFKQTKLIVGLGNVGKEYIGTRHNASFAAIEHFADSNDFPAWLNKKDLHCHITSRDLDNAKVILVKPTTLMNLSGLAVQKVQNFYRLSNRDTLVIQDELDLPIGSMRCHSGEQKRGSAGHNGIKSLVQYIGEDFGRLRIGVAGEHKTNSDSADYVLAKFSAAEIKALPAIYKEVEVLINEFLAAEHMPTDTRTVDI